jgi:hypothetical protein
MRKILKVYLAGFYTLVRFCTIEAAALGRIESARVLTYGPPTHSKSSMSQRAMPFKGQLIGNRSSTAVPLKKPGLLRLCSIAAGLSRLSGRFFSQFTILPI